MSKTEEHRVLRFYNRAKKYVRQRGWNDADVDDIVSCMVLDALEHPEKNLSVARCYLHALDEHDPRHVFHGERLRLSKLRYGIDEGDAVDREDTFAYPTTQNSWYAMGAQGLTISFTGKDAYHAKAISKRATLRWTSLAVPQEEAAPDPLLAKHVRRCFEYPGHSSRERVTYERCFDVVQRHFYSGETEREIACGYQVTESRVSQLYTQAIAKLRAYFV